MGDGKNSGGESERKQWIDDDKIVFMYKESNDMHIFLGCHVIFSRLEE